jgi:hypothetical protein
MSSVPNQRPDSNDNFALPVGMISSVTSPNPDPEPTVSCGCRVVFDFVADGFAIRCRVAAPMFASTFEFALHNGSNEYV